MKKVLTTCEFCGCGCNFYLGVEDNRVVAVYPCCSHPVSQGKLCIKGWQGHEYIHSLERLTTPLVRQGDKFREASWDEAYELITDRLQHIKEKYRPPMKTLPLAERLPCFAQVVLSFDEEKAIEETKRCLRCDLEEH